MNKNDVLEILDYMFEFIFSHNIGDGLEIDDSAIKNYLTDAGFEAGNVDEALEYLINSGDYAIENPQNISQQSTASIRFFSPDEIDKMTKQGCALLSFLEINHTLSPQVREIIIDHAMSTHYDYEFDEFLWLTQCAILNQDSEDLRETLFGCDYELEKASAKH
jgi:uncharacterized protein Smg (DUF494 family)